MQCELEDLSVYYELLGDGRPVLFLHGWSLDHRYEIRAFEPIFRARPGWRRLYLNLPGHGRTPSAERITCQDDMLEVVLSFLDRVIPDQRFLLVGTSAGALLARGVVYRRPEMIDGLLLRNPLIIADDARRSLPEFEVVTRDEAFMATLPPEEVEALSQSPIQTESYVKLLEECLEQDIFPAQQDADQPFLDRIRPDPSRYGFSFDVDALPNPFPAPTLIICGRQDTAVGYRDAWATLENYPRATFVVLDRAEHLIPIEQETLFTALVHDWLDRVEEYRPRTA